MPYHIDEENSELAFEVREGNKLVIKIKSNIFSDSLELYLIKVGDNTEPTDKNVFSSLRVLKEIENLHDTILKEINSVTSGFWELKQDSQGNEYIATKYNVLTEGGLTTYGLGEQKLGTIYDGLPIDNDTIYWEEVEGSRVLKAKGSGGGGAGLDETKLWNVLGTPGNQQIDYSHLSDAFSQFNNDFVTIGTEQTITALKHFTAGLSIGSAKKKIYEKDGVLYIDSNVAITGALTMYATDGQSVSSIYDGLPIDNDTIYWGTVEGSRVLKAKGGSSFDENAMWSALSGSSNNQINKSHLTDALAGYATTEALNSVSNKLNDFLEGSDTDNIINKWKELEAFLSGMAETDNLAEILETKADKKYVDSTFVTLATKQTITGEKTFSSVLNTAAIKASGEITTPSLAASDYVTIAGIKLRKLEDGALMLEGNLALTGALTMYASNGQSFDTIYDGLPIDNDTIYWQEVDGSRVLKAREGSGSSFDKSAMWTALAGSTTEQINKSHLTTALTGYATESWVSGKNYAVKATTLAGYGITDGINAVSVTGTGNAVTAASISGHTLTLTKGATFNNYTHPTATATTITAANGKVLSAITVNNQGHVTSVSGKTLAAADIPTLEISKISGLQDSLDAKLESSAYTAADVLAKLKTVDGSNSGLDADLLDGTHKTALFTALTSSSATNISITVGGTTKSIADLFANSAAKLETARTIWGQSFDGTKPVTGALTSVTDITGTGTFTGANLKATDSVYVNGIRLHKTSDGVITLEGNLAVTGGITTYAIDPVSVSTVMDGVVVDGTTIKKENGKLVAVGGGEAGSVAWGNITGKPSVFSTNIANITDLHSSWDSVLAAQKPSWLTAVSIATISDLHANWDALLKAAPSAYVTRWPTISEVTNKQNLVIKLNGGTTEGTNKFTYNATAAKSLNITPAGIGAATSGHTHAMSAITDLHSSWDALLKAAPSSYVTRWPTFAEVTSKPNSLSGYGITDGVNSVSFAGSGNAITSASISGHKLTLTKGNTFVLLKERNINTTNKGLWDIDKTNGSANCWNNPINTALQLQNNNNALAIIIDGNENGRMANIQVGHENTNYAANVGVLYLNRLGGDVYIGTTLAATINSNVASATKLQNTRYLWGVAFDGTKNIEGTITIYSDNTYDVGTDACNFNNVYSRILRNTKGRDMVITQDANYGLLFRTNATNRIYITASGNVGINRNDPSFTLDVSGNFRASLMQIGTIETNTYGTGEWTDATMLSNATIKSVAYGAVAKSSAHCHIGWKDVISGVGYSTYYAIGSTRGNSNWGSLYLAVGNNDAGTSVGCKFYLKGYGQAELIGDLLVTGGGTFYSSDIRYKSIIQQTKLSLSDIAKAPSFIYHWNKEGMNCDRLNLGGSAQYTQSVLPWAVENSNNFLSMDYATVAYTFAVHTARHLLTYESRTDKKIKKLENRVKYLEKQLKKLGYEEVRTLDDQSV
jgi:hypothetical protein